MKIASVFSHALHLPVAAALLMTVGRLGAAEAQTAAPAAIPIDFKHPRKHPFIACAADELKRLRDAYNSKGPARDAVAWRVLNADQALTRPIDFPPEGGQHNQWYQCHKCQVPLQTIDRSHHKCPLCSTVYSGYPFDHVIYEREFNDLTYRMIECAWAYALTGQQKYSDYAAAILRGFAERYLGYEYHTNYTVVYGGKTRGGAPITAKDRLMDQGNLVKKTGGRVFEQTLNEAVWLVQLCTVYDLIHDSPSLKPSDHQLILKKLIEPVCQSISQNEAGMSNWQSWHNAGMLWAGAIMDDAKWIDRAINNKNNGFLYQLGVSLSPDGMWYENSFSYHFYALDALMSLTEGARRIGIDLYSCRQMKAALMLPIQYVMSDGTLPRSGNSVRCSLSSAARLYEIGYAAYKEPLMLIALGNAPTWESVMYGRDLSIKVAPPEPESALLDGAGHAILRAKGPKKLSAMLTFSEFGGFHGHFDKLSFVLYGLGREIAVDRGRAESQAYRLPIHQNWYRATISHNAVVVDRASQRGVGAACDLFAFNDKVAAAAAWCDKAYPDLTHRRLLCLDADYLLVLDLLEDTAGKERTFDLFFHINSKHAQCQAASAPAALPKAAGYEYIEKAKAGRTAEAVSVKFVDTRATTYLTVAAGGETEVLTGEGRGESVQVKIPLAMITRKGASAMFASVMEPVAVGKTPRVKSVAAEKTGSGALIRVKGEGFEDVYSYEPQPRERAVEGVKTADALLCLRRAAGGLWETRLAAANLPPRQTDGGKPAEGRQ